VIWIPAMKNNINRPYIFTRRDSNPRRQSPPASHCAHLAHATWLGVSTYVQMLVRLSHNFLSKVPFLQNVSVLYNLGSFLMSKICWTNNLLPETTYFFALVKLLSYLSSQTSSAIEIVTRSVEISIVEQNTNPLRT
jgi:hypothetical protein